MSFWILFFVVFFFFFFFCFLVFFFFFFGGGGGLGLFLFCFGFFVVVFFVVFFLFFCCCFLLLLLFFFCFFLASRTSLGIFVMTYLNETPLRSFSPFCPFMKDSCQFLAKECIQYLLTLKRIKIERKAMIRNRYRYPTPTTWDIKGKET